MMHTVGMLDIAERPRRLHRRRRRGGAVHLPSSFPGWLPTRYEEKARADGHAKSSYFSFQRV